MSTQAPTRPLQTLISAVVLVALAGIAAGVALSKFCRTRSADDVSSAGAVIGASTFVHLIPDSLVTGGELEHYTAETLYERINGKAESYISKGFVALDVQEFHLVGRPAAYLSLWVYDMAEAANAFAAFSTQRRLDAVDLDLTDNAYASGGSIYFTHGPCYVEVQILPDSPPELADAALAVARNFIERTSVGPDDGLEGETLLPEAHRLANSIQLLKSDAFGFAGLDNVWLARYDVDGVTVTGYASGRSSPAEAEALAKSYIEFLEQLGATEGAPDGEPPTGMIVRDLYGHTYVIIHRGRVFGGVHECPDLGAAYGLGLEILAHLSERVDE